MSSIHNVSAEDLAKLFHHYHEALAHDFHGHASRQADLCWEQAPQDERKLMIAAARLTLLELAATSERAQTIVSILPSLARRIGAARLSGWFQLGLLYEVFTNPLAHFYASGCQMILAASS